MGALGKSPAFPNAHDNGWAEGMSQRDWLAGMALPATAAQAFAEENPRDGTEPVFEKAAYWAYELADAMLLARQATPNA